MRKQEKRGNKLKIDISENKRNDQRLYYDELTDTEIYSMVDDIRGIKITPTDSNASPCLQ